MAESVDPQGLPLGPKPKMPETAPVVPSKASVNEEVLNRFRFHPATPKTGPRHDEIRLLFEGMADDVLVYVPPGRHQSLALTALQESMMWCNAGIACDS